MTAMYAYTTVKSATVMPPKPKPANAPRFAALRAIMAERDCTAIQAMIHMERKDRHRALLPAGGKTAAIPSSETFHSRVIAALSDEWQNYKAFVGISPGASKGNVMETLRVLSRENRIECRKTSGLKGAEYRRLQATP
jgi:hypothetical protein